MTTKLTPASRRIDQNDGLTSSTRSAGRTSAASTKPASLRSKVALGLRDEMSTPGGRALRSQMSRAVGAPGLVPSGSSTAKLDGARLSYVRQPRSADDAAFAARLIVESKSSFFPSGYNSTVLYKPQPVNAADDTNPATPRFQDASNQLALNAEFEKQALARLSPSQRVDYVTLKRALLSSGEGHPKGDPVAALALQAMLFEGTLTQGSPALITALGTMAREPMAKGLDRATLLADTVQELAVPDAVCQGTKATCGAASALQLLLRENPSEYVRLTAGLASPKGLVQTLGGEWLAREDDALGDDSGRSLSQKLLEPAAMELANGNGEYDNQTDISKMSDRWSIQGLNGQQIHHLAESLFGKHFDHQFCSDSSDQKKAMKALVKSVKNGEPVLAGLKYTVGGKDANHEVLVVGVYDDDKGKKYVRFINPWGQEESMAQDEFQRRLNAIDSLPKSS